MLEYIFAEFVRPKLPILVVIGFLVYLLRNYFNRGLHSYPGPFLAKFTDLWRFAETLVGQPYLDYTALHKIHGDVVRLGPNALSFAQPEALKDIYGLNKGFIKSEFYSVFSAQAQGKTLPSLFSTTNEAFHSQLRRSVNSAFAMSTLVQYEPGVDTMIETFLRRTEELYVDNDVACDFMTWLQYFAFDAIGQITYSKPHGFIERNEDVDGIVAFLRWMFDYSGPVGQLPLLDLFLLKNPVKPWLEYFGLMSATSPIVEFARARISERLGDKPTSTEQQGDEEDSESSSDLLSKFLQAKRDRPEFFHDGRVLVMAVSMAFAGSETTAISLSAIFYYLLKNPKAYRALLKELETALADGHVKQRDNGLISWSEAQDLPYLDAAIKEAFRLHPTMGMTFERVVPPQGATICGRRIAGGTIVGVSPWVVHRRPEIFGEDVDDYRPERWLEASVEAQKEMEATMFHFSAGSRTCIGKNISLLDIYKLVPAVLLKFKVTMEEKDTEWIGCSPWFVRPRKFSARFELRDPEAR